MNTLEIVQEILRREDIKASKFSKLVGVAPGYVSDLKRSKTHAFSMGLINKILDVFPHYSKTWLMTGEGPILNEEKGEKKKSSDSSDLAETVNALIATCNRQSEQIDALMKEVSRQTAANNTMLQELIGQRHTLFRALARQGINNIPDVTKYVSEEGTSHPDALP